MAFHPMRTFQKNQKFWMASILLVCMVTFVLCTGLQGGDFAGWLMSLLGRQHGHKVAEIDGRGVYGKEIEDLKLRREVANEYMRKATEYTLMQLKSSFDELGKEKIKEDLRKRKYNQLAQMQAELAHRLQGPRYFDGGTKLDDLLDFIIWRNQADRLNIQLTEKYVKDMVKFSVFDNHLQHFRQDIALRIQRDVQVSHYGANYSVLLKALTEEFRVRIAKLTLEQSISRMLQYNAEKGGYEVATQTRQPLTPQQLFQFYQQNRAEAEIGLVPIRAAKFLKDISLPKDSKEADAILEAFFKKYQNKRYDPTTEEPGFQFPEQAKIQFVTANPESAFYKRSASVVTTLQATPAVQYNPMQTPLLAAATYAARSAAWDASLARNYGDFKAAAARQELMLARDPEFFFGRQWYQKEYQIAPLTDPFALALLKGVKKPKAENVAALVVSFTDGPFGTAPFAGYQTAAYFREASDLAPVIKHEVERRTPFAASLVLAGSDPALAATLAGVGGQIPQYLPLLGPLKEDLRQKLERTIYIEPWVKNNMQTARDLLEGHKGEELLFRDDLRTLKRDYGLETGVTENLVNRFDVDADPALQPLRKAYEKWYPQVNIREGRGGTAGVLKEDDFYRLFFGGEGFSVGNSDPYSPKPWPPTVHIKPDPLQLAQRRVGEAQTIQLFNEAEQPFLFWNTKKVEARPAKNFQEVRQEVEHAWKVNKAREELLLKHAKKVTAAVQTAAKNPDADLRAVLREQAQQERGEVLVLHHVAPLVEFQERPLDGLGYKPYELPRGNITYPRPDTAKDLVALRDLKEPLKTGNKALDALNKALFDSRGKGKTVQVLTNRPRTDYYVAVVLEAPKASEEQFFRSYAGAVGQGAGRDLFVDVTQGEMARRYREQLMAQMRDNARLEVTAEGRKQFDTDVAK